MRNATDLLAQYAEYHRDRRNIVSHFIGVPMIVFGVGVLLARATFPAFGTTSTLAWVVFALAAAWYLTRGNIVLGIAVSVAVGILIKLGHEVSGGSVGQWLAWGVGFFLVGWVIQFVGHWYEGRKPAFVDALIGLLVGPMFVVLELLAMAGWFKSLVERIEHRVGPTIVRDLAHPAT
jgi:uncharacterized membrane protein YGL010W